MNDPQTAAEKVDYLMGKVRELEARLARVENRYDHAFGQLPPTDAVAKHTVGNSGTLHLPKRS